MSTPPHLHFTRCLESLPAFKVCMPFVLKKWQATSEHAGKFANGGANKNNKSIFFTVLPSIVPGFIFSIFLKLVIPQTIELEGCHRIWWRHQNRPCCCQLPGLLYSVAAARNGRMQVAPQGMAEGFLSATRLEVPGVRVWLGIFQNHWGFKHVGCVGDGGDQKSTRNVHLKQKNMEMICFIVFCQCFAANIWWKGWYISGNTYQNIANRLRFLSRMIFL